MRIRAVHTVHGVFFVHKAMAGQTLRRALDIRRGFRFSRRQHGNGFLPSCGSLTRSENRKAQAG